MYLAALEFPANAMYLNSILIQLMTFDIIEPLYVLEVLGLNFDADFELAS